MLTITPREAPSLVAGRITVYHHAQTRQKPIHRTHQCHPESNWRRSYSPWASTVSYDASVPSRQEDAHTSSYRRSYYESLPSPRGTLGTQVLLSITLPSRPGEPVPDAGLPSRHRAISISM